MRNYISDFLSRQQVSAIGTALFIFLKARPVCRVKSQCNWEHREMNNGDKRLPLEKAARVPSMFLQDL